MATVYKVNEFAGLTGVTVKALHHYDRLALLKPRRSDAGYRIYTVHDLERLEQIIAPKFLGLPLKQIASVLGRGAIALPDALRLQRQALEEKRQLLSRAIDAIEDAEKEIRPGEAIDPAALKRLIFVLGIQQVDLTQYYSKETLSRMKQFFESAPSSEWVHEWQDLRRDILAAIEEDPPGATGRALVLRWKALTGRNAEALSWVKAPAVAADFKKLRESGGLDLPSGVIQRFQESSTAKVVPFLNKAMAALSEEVETVRANLGRPVL